MPPKSSKQYWLDREQAEDAAMEMVGDVIAREQYVVKQQSAIFDAALREMDRELDILLKDVGQNAIDRAKMQKPLTPKELSAWSARQRDRLDRLISQYGDKEGRKRFGAENAKTAKQDRANRIVRRQEALKQSMEAISSNAAAKSESVTQKALEIEARNGVDAFKKQFGVNTQVKFNTVSKGEINALIKTEWKGGNYSSRIWKDRDEMVKDLERAINQGVANGWSVQRIAKEVQHHVNKGKQSAERIARTEMNRISNAAELASYKANGVHYYRFMATHDARTCPICGELHDKVFAVDNASTGDNFPPVHPNCRCRTIGSFVDEDGKDDDKWLDELGDEVASERGEDEDEETSRDDAKITNSMATGQIAGFENLNTLQLSDNDWEIERELINEAKKKDDDFGKFLNRFVVDGQEPIFELAETAFNVERNLSDAIGKKIDAEYHFITDGEFSKRAKEILSKLSPDVAFTEKEFDGTDGLFWQTDKKTGKGVILIKRNVCTFAMEHELIHAAHSMVSPVSFQKNIPDKEKESDPLNADAKKDWARIIKSKKRDYYIHAKKAFSQFDIDNANAIFGKNADMHKLPNEDKQIIAAFSEVVGSISRSPDVALLHKAEDFGRMNIEVVPYVCYVIVHGSDKAILRLVECFPHLVKRCQLLFDGHYHSTMPKGVGHDDALGAAGILRGRLRTMGMA